MSTSTRRSRLRLVCSNDEVSFIFLVSCSISHSSSLIFMSLHSISPSNVRIRAFKVASSLVLRKTSSSTRSSNFLSHSASSYRSETTCFCKQRSLDDCALVVVGEVRASTLELSADSSDSRWSMYLSDSRLGARDGFAFLFPLVCFANGEAICGDMTALPETSLNFLVPPFCLGSLCGEE